MISNISELESGASAPFGKASGFCKMLSVVMLSVGAVHAAETDKPAKAEVIFDHPENFRDVRDAYMPSETSERGQLEMLRRYLTEVADSYIPDGCKLTMTFTDIDLAGDFEPWRGPQADDIRIIRDIYPPNFKFTW